ncbi:hypothetical protein DFQ28_002066 [Apophysomyces sp. BC1034]|nr:hypothetical protein DFQ30_002927 [Apophysomyces sp. BC1015]KAG0182368.1 hypothetical protein DFQ28_002066 [Apophysomyces sp. BC1034]
MEYRQPEPLYDDFTAEDNRVNGIWVRYAGIGGSVKNYQLNASPHVSSLKESALTVNKELHDAQAGLRIRVCSTDKEGAVFSVALHHESLPECSGSVAVPVTETPVKDSQTTPTPLVSGTGTAGAEVTVVKSYDPGRVLARTAVGANGKWQVLIPQALPYGTYSVSA